MVGPLMIIRAEVMLGENADAPIDGWVISEGDIEKSTANRLGLLTCRQGLSVGETGPADAKPGKSINKGFEARTTKAYMLNLTSILPIQTGHTASIQYAKMDYAIPTPKRENRLGRRSALESRSLRGWSKCSITLGVVDRSGSYPMTREMKQRQAKHLPML